MRPRKHIGIVCHAYPSYDGDFRANFIEALADAYSEFAEVTVFVPFVRTWKRPKGVSFVATLQGKVRLYCYRYVPLDRWHIVGSSTLMHEDLLLRWSQVLAAPLMCLIGAMRIAVELRRAKIDVLHAHWAVPNTFVG